MVRFYFAMYAYLAKEQNASFHRFNLYEPFLWLYDDHHLKCTFTENIALSVSTLVYRIEFKFEQFCYTHSDSLQPRISGRLCM